MSGLPNKLEGNVPYGNKVGPPAKNPKPWESAVQVINKRDKYNYVSSERHTKRPPPGYIPLTVAGITGYRDLQDYKSSPSLDFDEALVVNQTMNNNALKPHQWIKDELPIDRTHDDTEEFFNSMSNEQALAKVQALRERGFNDEQINSALSRIRDREIDKVIRNPIQKHLPAVLSQEVKAKVVQHHPVSAAPTTNTVLPKGFRYNQRTGQIEKQTAGRPKTRSSTLDVEMGGVRTVSKRARSMLSPMGDSPDTNSPAHAGRKTEGSPVLGLTSPSHATSRSSPGRNLLDRLGDTL